MVGGLGGRREGQGEKGGSGGEGRVRGRREGQGGEGRVRGGGEGRVCCYGSWKSYGSSIFIGLMINAYLT